MPYTHKIISMVRSQTANTQSPMWRCQCENGDRFNVFNHADPKKNTFSLFAQSGYEQDMLAMKLDARLIWKKYPIEVQLEKTPDGKWWDVKAVAPRIAGACADVPFNPDVRLFRERARRVILSLMETPDVCIIDTETTGLEVTDEVIEIAALDCDDGECIFHYLVQPENLDAARPNPVSSYSPDEFADALNWRALYHDLRQINACIWVAYNANFDYSMISNTCAKYNLVPLSPLAVVDVMPLIAEYVGQWDEMTGRFKNWKQTEVAAMFGLSVDGAHTALADAGTLYGIMQAIADEVQPVLPDQPVII